MSKLSQLGNINYLRKTFLYLKKNGWKKTFYAVLERLSNSKKETYQYVPISNEEIARQKSTDFIYHYKISLLVPAYETNPRYLKEMLDSVSNQTYDNWELIIADASVTNQVELVVKEYLEKHNFEDIVKKIIYIKLEENAGISQNTNIALSYATGEYIGLLDHDDVLTCDALFEMVTKLEAHNQKGIPLFMVYSDEDKTDGEMRTFFEPNKKDDFNLDLLLSNNYICHFTIIKSELMKALKFRPEFDGAQDHDIFLRVVQYCLIQDNLKKDHFDVLQKRIGHVSKVLYHWRCHTSSTAENPASKLYAYEAGGRAIEDFCKKAGWQVTVQPTDHLGFFRVNYELGLMRERGRVGAIGGPIISQGKIVSGALKKDGTPIYYGLNKHYSGYMHKAILMQEVDALDLANIRVREEVKDIFIECLKLFSVDIKSKKGEDFQNRKSASLEFARRLHEKGYCMVYDPQMVK